MTIQPQQVIAGRYRLLRPLAEGGMGTLWIARHEELHTELALKFVTGLDPKPAAIERFKREARAAAQLRGRQVVHIYDFGFEDEQPFIAMELLRGESFAQLIERRAPVSLDTALDWFRQLSAGLRLAHGAGIVHRDIKPSNLFLAEDGDQRVVKMLDFGIAKRANAGTWTTTTTGMIVGSPGYMSPEQARGQRVDARSDLWSAAVVLYELVTGHVLFASAHAGDSIARTCSEPVPLASGFVSALPKSVDVFFARALERDPARRYANAEQLLSAFESACRGCAELEPPCTPAARDGDSRPDQGRDGPTLPVKSAAASGAYELAWNRDARAGRASRRWILMLAALAPLLALNRPNGEQAAMSPRAVPPRAVPALTDPQTSQPAPRAANPVESERPIGFVSRASGQSPALPAPSEASTARATNAPAPARPSRRGRTKSAAPAASPTSAQREMDPFSGLVLE